MKKMKKMKKVKKVKKVKISIYNYCWLSFKKITTHQHFLLPSNRDIHRNRGLIPGVKDARLPFREPIKNAEVIWIELTIRCRVKYLELDEYGLMRHASFRGIVDFLSV
jgi:hypothetical protein